MKQTLLVILLIFTTSSPLLAEKFECTVIRGVYYIPGSTELSDAINRDPSLNRKVFYVDRDTGRVTGSALFDNEKDKVQILRNVNDIIDVFVVSSVSEKANTRILSIMKHEDKITFTYYNEFFGLFLTGACQKV